MPQDITKNLCKSLFSGDITNKSLKNIIRKKSQLDKGKGKYKLYCDRKVLDESDYIEQIKECCNNNGKLEIIYDKEQIQELKPSNKEENNFNENNIKVNI